MLVLVVSVMIDIVVFCWGCYFLLKINFISFYFEIIHFFVFIQVSKLSTKPCKSCRNSIGHG